MKKEEIRHDPVREKIIKSIDFLKNNKNIAISALTIIIIFLSLMSYYKYSANLKDENASRIAGLAQHTFINGQKDAAYIKFERTLHEYPNTAGAIQSIIYLLSESIKSL